MAVVILTAVRVCMSHCRCCVSCAVCRVCVTVSCAVCRVCVTVSCAVCRACVNVSCAVSSLIPPCRDVTVCVVCDVQRQRRWRPVRRQRAGCQSTADGAGRRRFAGRRVRCGGHQPPRHHRLGASAARAAGQGTRVGTTYPSPRLCACITVAASLSLLCAAAVRRAAVGVGPLLHPSHPRARRAAGTGRRHRRDRITVHPVRLCEHCSVVLLMTVRRVSSRVVVLMGAVAAVARASVALVLALA